jgi:hypothetical protein
MRGFIYRWGVRIKDWGERMAHKSLKLSDRIIRLGLAIRDWASRYPIH